MLYKWDFFIPSSYFDQWEMEDLEDFDSKAFEQEFDLTEMLKTFSDEVTYEN